MRTILKTTLATAGLLLITQFAQADINNAAMPTSLKANMKSMATILKTMTAQVNDPSKNESSAKLADELIGLSEHNKSFTPDSIQSAPSSEQESQSKLYNKEIDDLTSLAKNLSSAFRSNDNKLAVQILNDMNALRKQGHNDFK